jgi:hypothetical protein
MRNRRLMKSVTGRQWHEFHGWQALDDPSENDVRSQRIGGVYESPDRPYKEEEGP